MSNKKWTDGEISYLKNNYSSKTDEEIGKILKRSSGAIEAKRSILGLKKRTKLSISDKDKQIILNSNLTYSEIADKFSITSEQARSLFRYNTEANYLHTNKRWSLEEDRFLLENYNSMSDSKIGEHLNRTTVSVLKRRKRLDLIRESRIIDNPSEKTWSDEEIMFLCSNIDKLSYDEISKKINRSIRAVMVKASKLGIVSDGSKWSENEDKVLLSNLHRTKYELSFLLNRTPKAIQHRCNGLGVKLGSVRKETELEIKIENILKDLKVEYNTQVVLGSHFNYRADFVIGDIVIEAHGDYWHGNPVLYSSPNKMQSLMIERDALKKSYFESLGYEVFVVWEMEVNNNYLLVKESIARLLGNFQESKGQNRKTS